MKTLLYDLDEIQESDLNNLSKNEELQTRLLERVPNETFSESEIRYHAERLLEHVSNPASSLDIGEYAVKKGIDVLEFFALCSHPYFSIRLEESFSILIYRFSSAFERGIISQEEFERYKKNYSSSKVLRQVINERKREQFKDFAVS